MSFDLKKYLQNNPLLEKDFKFTDPEVDPHTGAITHTVKYLPNFKKAYDDLEDAKNSMSALASKDELISDTQLKRIKDLVRDSFNKYRTHLRNNYRDEYNSIKGRGGVDEMSTSGDAGGYDTPYAFSKNKNRKYKPVNPGFTTVNSKQLRKKAKGTDYIDLM